MSNQQFFQQVLSQESSRFHDVIAALPADKLDYRHDPKSRSAKELVSHLIGHFDDLVELVDAGVIHHRVEVPFSALSQALAMFDRGVGEAAAKLKQVDDDQWAAEGEFVVGGKAIIKASCQALAWMLLLDAIHHRGQLSTLIRPMGGKVPSIYGPSADTQMVS